MKKVVYTGALKGFYGYSDPRCLIKGNIYEIEMENKKDFHTECRLKGIEGIFNGVWFEEVKSTYLAVSEQIPTLGKKYKCKKLIFQKDKHSLESVTTEVVEDIAKFDDKVYNVSTQDGIYIVQVS